MIYDPLCIIYRTITNIPRYLEIPIVIGIYGLLHNYHNLLFKKKENQQPNIVRIVMSRPIILFSIDLHTYSTLPCRYTL